MLLEARLAARASLIAAFLSVSAVAQTESTYPVGPEPAPVLGAFDIEMDVTLTDIRVLKNTTVTELIEYGTRTGTDISAQLPATLDTTFRFSSAGLQFTQVISRDGREHYTYASQNYASGPFEIGPSDTAFFAEQILSEEKFREFLGISPAPATLVHTHQESNNSFVMRPAQDASGSAIYQIIHSQAYYADNAADVNGAIWSSINAEYGYRNFLRINRNFTDYSPALTVEAFVDKFFREAFSVGWLSTILYIRSDEGENGVVGYDFRANVVVNNIRTSVDPVYKPATCSYKMLTDWNSGFVGAVHIKNNTDQPIDGWNIGVDFADAVVISNAWNAELSGTSPSFDAKPLSWNALIHPGQEINFGFQATKAPGQSSSATISGDICK